MTPGLQETVGPAAGAGAAHVPRRWAADGCRRSAQLYAKSWAQDARDGEGDVRRRRSTSCSAPTASRGLMLHHEMALFVQAGIPPRTSSGWRRSSPRARCGIDKKIGSIAAGKRADLVVVDGDPLEDIKQIRSTVFTMRARRPLQVRCALRRGRREAVAHGFAADRAVALSSFQPPPAFVQVSSWRTPALLVV